MLRTSLVYCEEKKSTGKMINIDRWFTFDLPLSQFDRAYGKLQLNRQKSDSELYANRLWTV